MVASTHWLASQSGMTALERGGNAFDAAVTAGFCLQVVEPHLNGPGGEVPVIGWDAGTDSAFVVCGQGVAPQAATIGRFRELGVDLVPGAGMLAACVPGAFGGWLRLLRTHGTMSLRDVLDHAIGFARHGFPLLPSAAATIAGMADFFAEHWPSSARQWLSGGPPRPGMRFRNLDLAATYERILTTAERASTDRDGQIDAALDCFYRGFVAERIDGFYADRPLMDSSGRAHRGLLGAHDLAEWRATEEEPVNGTYRDWTVLKAGPWTQGPVFLQQLALLDGLDPLGGSPVDFVHMVVECAKLAFADREAWYGDPEFVDVPLSGLLSASYARERRELIGEHADTGPLRPGRPDDRDPALPSMGPRRNDRSPRTSVGEPTVQLADGDTCHVAVADRWGNLVSATPSGGWLQSSPAVPDLGFCLGTRAQMFWLEEGLAGSLAPGKRPRTTLTPSLALHDGVPALAFGTPGGDAQDQWTLQFFLRHVHGMALQEAIDEPTFHSTHFPSSFYPRQSHPGRIHLESRFGTEVVEELTARGHDVVVEEPWSLGRVNAVSRDPDGTLRAGSSSRGDQCYAVGR